MMKRIVFMLLACAMTALTAVAQNTIESIRKEYQDVQQSIREMMQEDGYPPEYYNVHVVQNLPGTGPHDENMYFFYNEEEQDSEEEDYNPYPPHYLRFVTAKYNFAARQFYEEYLYDEKGQVKFIYARTPDVEDVNVILYELRMWFNGKRLLRLLVKKNESDDWDHPSFKDVYTGATIPQLYSSECERLKGRAQCMLVMFKAIDEHTYQ